MTENAYGLKRYRHVFNVCTVMGARLHANYGSTNRPWIECEYSDYSDWLGTGYDSAMLYTVQIDNPEWEYQAGRHITSERWEVPEWPVEPIFIHYAHIIRDETGAKLVRFVASEDHGKRGRLSTIKPGRYLTKFYPELDGETVKTMVSDLDKETPVHFAVTADEIAHVYKNGPSSCMAYPDHHYKGHMHPVRVYGDSDVQCAYMMKAGNINGRTLVWPAKKLMIRVYGDTRRLENALKALGYTYGSLDGARIHAIQDNDSDCYIMPYVDKIDEASLSSCGKWFILGSGDYNTQLTNGLTDEKPEGCYCEIMEETFPEDEGQISSDSGQWVSNEAVSNGYAWRCEYSGRVYTDQDNVVLMANCEYVSLRGFEARDGYHCDQTGEAYLPRDECPIFINDTEETVCHSWAVDNAYREPISGDWFSDEEAAQEALGTPSSTDNHPDQLSLDIAA